MIKSQLCMPSMLFFVFTVLFKPSFNVLRHYFCVSCNLLSVTVCILKNLVTQLFLELGHLNPGGGTPHMKKVGILVGNFELNPQRRPTWAWLKLFLTPKRDHVKTQTKYMYFYIFFACNLKRELHG